MTPYPKLAGFYFLYFGIIGLLLPYWSPYLASQGFGPEAIGLLLAVGHASRLYAPYLWGWLADTCGRRMLLVRLGCGLAALCFSGVYLLERSLAGWLLLMLAFHFFLNAALPQFEAVALNHLGTGAHRYSRLRLWGSLGFIATAGGLGGVVADGGIVHLPALLLGLFGLLLGLGLTIPEHSGNRERHEPSYSLVEVLRQPPVVSLLLVSLLIHASHGPYYTFFSLHTAELGYAGTTIGLLWAEGVAAEVVVFALVPVWLMRFDPRVLMQLTLALTALRWLLTGWFSDRLEVLLLAQLLHGFSFGLYHAVAIALVHRHFTGHL
ncbi:MAG: MFS transporter, partial [Candidatus Competibacterales bacterium]|nr:MFS transporter [Candidatus Competibacterales bacterium]